MDSALKQRLIGAAVLVALAMIFLPMLLKGPDTTEPDAARVPLEMPAAPDQAFETREVPLTLPAPEAPDGGVLGMDPRPAASDDPNAVATVDQTGLPPARTDVEPEPEDAPALAVDAATGNAGQAVHLGLRPEDMRLVSNCQQANTFAGTIAHIEKLGDASLLYVTVNAQTPLLTLKVEGTTTQAVGSTVHMHCPPEALHIFDEHGDACRRTPELPA